MTSSEELVIDEKTKGDRTIDQTLQIVNKGDNREPRQQGNKGLMDRQAIAPLSEKQRNVRRWGTSGDAQRPTRIWHLLFGNKMKSEESRRKTTKYSTRRWIVTQQQ